MANWNKPIILIAEDEENDRYLIEHAFKKARLELTVTLAFDGEQAIERLKQTPTGSGTDDQPVLLLLDLKMPRMDGFQVLQWLLEHPVNRPALVIILSSSCDPRDAERAVALGADSYLVKPNDFKQYVHIVEELAHQVMNPEASARQGAGNQPGSRSLLTF